MKTLALFLLLAVSALADTAATVANGIPVTFSVTVTGGTGTILTFQWQKNSVNIAGATTATYTIPKAAVVDSGTYDVIVKNPDGQVTSDKGLLTVNPPPVALNPPTAATLKISF